MEVGALQIKGSLDTSNIVRGQREISRGFETVKQKTQSTFTSMDLLAGSAAKVGNAMVNISAAAVGGLTLLAGLTPTLAPEFAKLKVETFKLAQVFGQEMKPAFEDATQAYSGFVNFISQDTVLSNFSKDLTLLVGAGGLLSLFSSKILGLKNVGKIAIPIAVAISVKKNIEEPVGNTIADLLSGIGMSEERSGYKGAFKSADEAGAGLGKLVTNLLVFGGTGAAGGAAFGGGIPGGIAGGIAGSIAGAGYTIYEIVREDFFNDVDSSGK